MAKILFPATILGHEIGHANQKEDKSPEQFNKERVLDDNNPYGSRLEEENITGVEQSIALKHGDIKREQTTRTNHNGTSMEINNLPENSILEDYDKDKVRPQLEQRLPSF